jgi:hypothetical protein
MEQKKSRIDLVGNCIKNIKDLSMLYRQASPAWVLILAAYEHINSLHHLEISENFDKKTLGAKND